MTSTPSLKRPLEEPREISVLITPPDKRLRKAPRTKLQSRSRNLISILTDPFKFIMMDPGLLGELDPEINLTSSELRSIFRDNNGDLYQGVEFLAKDRNKKVIACYKGDSYQPIAVVKFVTGDGADEEYKFAIKACELDGCVDVVEHGRIRDNYYMKMPYIGPSLFNLKPRMKDTARITEIVRHFAQTLKGLGDLNIHHNDMAGRNLLMKDDKLYVIDFEFATEGGLDDDYKDNKICSPLDSTCSRHYAWDVAEITFLLRYGRYPKTVFDENQVPMFVWPKKDESDPKLKAFVNKIITDEDMGIEDVLKHDFLQ
uniref:ORF54 n=1 Tax=Malaco herpesvirus 1 TaxID=3031797 RepID=A0AA48P8C6_9VIRU|nr:TPA_asm: ORF54 [Malaco herpesvirus 1]